MKKNQKGFTPILIIAIIAIVAVAGYFFLTKKGTYIATPSGNGSSTAIQNSSGLNNAENDLDNADINQVDTELNQLSSDTSSF
ncbi:hypothetical protein HY031_00630 [Candidatus Gottesmanbacteria bacterium]|nr:hypothetical protein [Candidatus Gottesmanbacteria bacterium]